MLQKIYHLSDSRRAALRFLASTIMLVLLVSLALIMKPRFLDPVYPVVRFAAQKIEWFFYCLF